MLESLKKRLAAMNGLQRRPNGKNTTDNRLLSGTFSTGKLPDAIPLPASINRLATHFDPGNGRSEKNAIREYGQKPGRTSLEMLSREASIETELAKVDLSQLKATDFPIVAVTKSAASFIIWNRTNTGYIIEGKDQSCVSAEKLNQHLSGHFIKARPNMVEQVHASTTSPDQMLRWLFNLIWKNDRAALSQLLLAAIICNIFLIALPLFIMSVYDRVVPHSAFASLQALTIGFILVLGADLSLRFVKGKLTDAIGLGIAHRLQMNLYRRLLTIRLSRKPSSASEVSNVQSELETICLLMPAFLTSIIADTTFAFVVLAIIANIGGYVVLAPLIGIMIVASVIFIGTWHSRENAQQASILRGAASAMISETFDSLTAVKANGSEHSLLRKFERVIDAAAIKGHLARQNVRFSANILNSVVQATIVGTLVLGVLRIDAGVMTIGSLAASTILVGRAIMPIGQLVDQTSRIWTLKEILQGTFSMISEKEEEGGEQDGGESRTFRGHLQLNNVGCRHESTDVEALKNINLEIKPGEKIGVIGKNGSGKSTLLHLFPRLYLPSSGTMVIDGYDARQYSPRRLRQEVGFMPQEIVLFNDSLRANICLGTEDYTEEEFNRAVELSGVERFARRHPHGYSMRVGPRGEFLSAGERQSVGLARVLLKPKTILALDEPSSLMDHTSEQQLIQSLTQNLKETTLVISTHRMKLLDLVDRVIVMDQGEITMDGSKQEVLTRLKQPLPAQQVRRSA
ncbi:ATP-binding cassette domain-containing protein [Parvularcula sp. IMCC14364]|uniref:ATP-binding cassette domain-containing protein n=1 Tax=Parvularcula sp. IMCC14364 TaxID=3067902 RepID=UPI0027413F42|nr:ATP-binding cassette domain-containing protein [Parvularcula sp. IMCC14364]